MKLPKDPYHIRLTGRGGQGIIMAGILVAEAGMFDGLNVVQTQSYGPEARLGATRSEVILSHGEIAFPEIEKPDFLLCLSLDGYLKHGSILAEDGLRVVESKINKETTVNNALIAPLLEHAETVGNVIFANVVALGVLQSLTNVVTQENLGAALERRIKPEFLELNKSALKEGFDLGNQLKDKVKSLA